MTCIAGREVEVTIRRRRAPHTVMLAKLVIPSQWRKSTLLAYCRSEHLDATVRLTSWGSLANTDAPWVIRRWLPNPRDFADFERGLPTSPPESQKGAER